MLEQPHHVVVYANPYSALCFARDKGFVPVARPRRRRRHETIVVAVLAPRCRPRRASPAPADKLIIHNLGLVLAQLGIDAAAAEV